IVATEDHPFFTKDGMKPIRDISYSENIAIFPFQGVEYEEPNNDIVISEEDIHRVLEVNDIKSGSWQHNIIINKLKKKGLIQIKYNSSRLPYLLKIMGFLLGDATMNFIGRKKDGILNFSGQPKDLEKARQDIILLGYTPSKVYSRVRKNG
ncbi:RNA-splicing ligase RtcB, partial [Candidatus Woesearchaeota archaeon]|nr:RNA-splicing ligase RtcB [Candidatus Woesearchaeota archaeon]